MRVNINLEGACRYLNHLAANKLHGLQVALAAKANELDLSPGTALTPATELGQEPTGNERGILRFVNSVDAESTDADKTAIATLLATVLARTGGSGLPQPRLTGGPVRRRGRRNRA
jgi:hypothetical protein